MVVIECTVCPRSWFGVYFLQLIVIKISIVSCEGCPYVSCICVLQFATFLVVVFVAELAVGISGFAYRGKVSVKNLLLTIINHLLLSMHR